MYISTFALETLASVILKKISIIFSYKYWHIGNIPIYLHCCNISKGYISNSSKISDYMNIVQIKATQLRIDS